MSIRSARHALELTLHHWERPCHGLLQLLVWNRAACTVSCLACSVYLTANFVSNTWSSLAAMVLTIYCHCLHTKQTQLGSPYTQGQLSDADSAGVQEVLDPMQPPGTPLPVFMGGQSMGGTLTILTALRDQSAWQACDCPVLPSLMPSLALANAMPTLNSLGACHRAIVILNVDVGCFA